VFVGIKPPFPDDDLAWCDLADIAMRTWQDVADTPLAVILNERD